MKDEYQWLESEIAKANKALSEVPKGEDLKVRAAFVPLKELKIALYYYNKFMNSK
jgi:hypothetical protein